MCPFEHYGNCVEWWRERDRNASEERDRSRPLRYDWEQVIKRLRPVFSHLTGDGMAIYFYSDRDRPYGCFSNFSRHGFELDGFWWPTSEHFFQVQKFAGTLHADEIRKVKTPKEAARMGREACGKLR